MSGAIGYSTDGTGVETSMPSSAGDGRKWWEPEPVTPTANFGMMQPKVTVAQGATKIGSRRGPSQAPTRREPMSMGEYDNGMGGMFGEAEQEGRGLTVDALGLARTAATGGAPSAAEILGQQGLDRAAGEQQSLAASARGPAALAQAQQQAAYNTANIQQQGAAQMAGLRAQEMDRAREQYLGGTGLLRGQDQSRYGAEMQRGMAQAGIDQQHQQGQAAWREAQSKAGFQEMGMGLNAGQAVAGGLARATDAQNSAEANYQQQISQFNQNNAAKRGALYQGMIGKGADTSNAMLSGDSNRVDAEAKKKENSNPDKAEEDPGY